VPEVADEPDLLSAQDTSKTKTAIASYMPAPETDKQPPITANEKSANSIEHGAGNEIHTTASKTFKPADGKGGVGNADPPPAHDKKTTGPSGKNPAIGSKASGKSTAQVSPVPWNPEDTVVPLVDDDLLPDGITPNAIFEILQVDKHFIIGKLQSCYSFDNFFKGKSNAPNLQSMRNKYKNPLTDKVKRKKPAPVKKDKQQVQVKGTKDSEVKDELLAEEEAGEPSEPPPTTPIVIGKMKTFKFLEQKNYVPDPDIRSREVKFAKELSDDEIYEFMVLAQQVSCKTV
jgi:hypothetical protein